MNKTKTVVYSILNQARLLIPAAAWTTLAVSFGLLLGCTAKTPSSSNDTRPTSVTLAIWPSYITPEMITDFETKTGFKLVVANFASNEELLGKLQAGASGYDVIVPSDYMVLVMRKLGLIQKLGKQKIPNSQSLDQQFAQKNYDPGFEYSVPYGWGTTGIAYNSEKLPKGVKSWNELFSQPNLKGHFSLLDDSRETIAAALKSQGLSLNSTDDQSLSKAKTTLIAVRSRVKAFNSEPVELLVTGEVWAAHAYSSDAHRAQEKSKGKIRFTTPSEGGTLWIDTLAIPSGAKNLDGAHALINYLLDSQVNLTKSLKVFTAPVLKDAASLLPLSLRNDRSFLPEPAVLSKFEMMEDLGEGTVKWDRVWTEVKAAR